MVTTDPRNKELSIIIQVDGGIGRVICSIPAIERLAQREPDRKIIIITTHPDVFKENPSIHRVYNLTSNYLWDDVIKHGEFVYTEPYYNYLYYTQKHHLIQAFDLLINGSEELETPTLYLTKEEVKWGEKLIEDIRKDHNKPVGVLQCFGAGAFIDGDKEFKDESCRSLFPNQVEMLMDELTDAAIFVNASHIPIDFTNVWQQQFTMRQLFSVIKASDFVVTVDSFSSHVGACFQKPGILILGATHKENVAYPHYQLIQRQGYPKGYSPNRFGGEIERHDDRAMCFSEEELKDLAKDISDLITTQEGIRTLAPEVPEKDA